MKEVIGERRAKRAAEWRRSVLEREREEKEKSF